MDRLAAGSHGECGGCRVNPAPPWVAVAVLVAPYLVMTARSAFPASGTSRRSAGRRVPKGTETMLQKTSRRYRWTLLLAALSLASCGPVRDQDCVWNGVARTVAVGDVHGDYGQFVKALRAAGVIDDKSNWIGGTTHLVQTGDVLDRGPDSRQVMDLLMDLEAQSRSQGGRVHALIGNHVAAGCAPLVRDATEDEQMSFDATARRLLRFLTEEQPEYSLPPIDIGGVLWLQEHRRSGSATRPPHPHRRPQRSREVQRLRCDPVPRCPGRQDPVGGCDRRSLGDQLRQGWALFPG